LLSTPLVPLSRANGFLEVATYHFLNSSVYIKTVRYTHFSGTSQITPYSVLRCETLFPKGYFCIPPNEGARARVDEVDAWEAEDMGKIIIDEGMCKGCALCINACPLNLIRISSKISSKGYYPAEVNDLEEKCTACTLCAITCPDVAITVYRERKENRSA